MLKGRVTAFVVAGILGVIPVAARTRALVIGVSDYTGDPRTNPVSYANNDAQLFNKYIGKGFNEVHTLNEPGSTKLFTIEFELNRVLAQAEPGDTVFIFVSARGVARPGSDGYIGTADMVSSKPESTALPVEYVRRLIAASRADRVILLADVSRRPAELFANQINLRIASLGAIPKPAVGGILATQQGQLSLESASLTHPPDPTGYGLFGFYVVTLGSPGMVTLHDLSQRLSARVPPETNGKQNPRGFGTDQAITQPVWQSSKVDTVDPSLLETAWLPSRFAPNPRRSETFLIAGLFSELMNQVFGASLLSWQAGPEVSRALDLKIQIARHQSIKDPGSLSTAILSLRDKIAAQDWENLRVQAVEKLAGDAQTVVNRYGMQDLLPGDPGRVSPSEFRAAGEAFLAARNLSPADRPYQEFRKMLEVRQLLCEGLSSPPKLRELERRRSEFNDVRIAEVHNALGIGYLELDHDYERSIKEFQAAKKLSPGWMYPRQNLALVYIESGDYGAAEREYREAVEATPLQPSLYYNYGLLLHRMNRKKDAKAEYEKAVHTYDELSSAFRARARDWSNLPREGQFALQRADVFQKNKGEVLNAWGALLASNGDRKNARRKYTDALVLNPELCPARDNLAQLEQTATEHRDERAVSVEAVRLLKANVEYAGCRTFHPSYLRLAHLEFRGGDLAKSEADYETALRLVPQNLEALSGIAAVEASLGKYTEAEKFLQEAIDTQISQTRRSLFTSNGYSHEVLASPLRYVELADVYRKSGAKRACTETYDLAIKAVSLGSVGMSTRELLRRQRTCFANASAR